MVQMLQWDLQELLVLSLPQAHRRLAVRMALAEPVVVVAVEHLQLCQIMAAAAAVAAVAVRAVAAVQVELAVAAHLVYIYMIMWCMCLYALLVAMFFQSCSDICTIMLL
jgi:hypothetical protein